MCRIIFWVEHCRANYNCWQHWVLCMFCVFQNVYIIIVVVVKSIIFVCFDRRFANNSLSGNLPTAKSIWFVYHLFHWCYFLSNTLFNVSFFTKKLKLCLFVRYTGSKLFLQLPFTMYVVYESIQMFQWFGVNHTIIVEVDKQYKDCW